MSERDEEYAYDVDDLIFNFHVKLRKMQRAYAKIFHDKYANEFIKEVACSIQMLRETRDELKCQEKKAGKVFIGERSDILIVNEQFLHRLYRILNRESELDKMLYS